MILDLPARLLVYAALHFIGDFPFQSTWMVMEKGKSWEIMLYHCLTYTAPFALMVLVPSMADAVTMQGLAFVCLSHMVVDTLKARYKVIKEIWVDQLLHVATFVFCVAVGWL